MKIKPKSCFLCEQFSVRGSVTESGDGTWGLTHAAESLCHPVTVPAPGGTVLIALSLPVKFLYPVGSLVMFGTLV